MGPDRTRHDRDRQGRDHAHRVRHVRHRDPLRAARSWGARDDADPGPDARSNEERRTVNLLSIDWDYFFFDKSGYGDIALYDWGHQESKLYIEMLWEIRASAFIRRDLPLPQTTGDERTFWDSIRVVENAPLYYGESHLMAVDPLVYTPMLED